MASLRARLLAAVLVLGAVGLLLLGAVTYAEERSFLLDRVDQQARSAPPAVAAALGGKDNAPTATIDTLKKDLVEMLAEARSRGYEAPATQAALGGFERASRAGLGAKDCTAVPVHWLKSGTAT